MSRLLIASVLLSLAVVSAPAQTSIYSSMTAAGNWQGFNAGHNNMYLISNQLWEGIFFISNRNFNSFKFVANGDWGPGLNWGAAITGSVPLSGTANLTNVFGADIRFTNVVEGFYRFRFHEGTKAFSVELLSHEYNGPAGNNLIRNGDFEQADLGDPTRAYAWNYRPAMSYGGRWGNSGRADWRYYSPLHQHYVGGSFGGVWQDTPAGRDFMYEASGWFWMDGASNTNFGPWTAAVQQLKIEFYSAFRGSPIEEAFTNIPFVPETWYHFSFRAPAPPQAAWARFVINVATAGPKGSLQFDDVALRAIPYPYQYFTTWDFTRTGMLARGGWVATNASMITATNLAYAAPTLALGNGGWICSPRIEQGLGRVVFRYRTSFADPENDPTDNLTVEVRASPTGAGDSFSTLATLNSIVQQSYTEFSISVNDPSQKYLELRVVNGTNLFLVDNIEILPAEPSPRFQDFALWTNAALSNAGCHVVNNWQLCTGFVFSAGAFQAPSARLPGRTNGANFIRTPLLTNGYGTISFQLARGNNGFAPVELLIQESPDNLSWTTVGSLSNVAETSWSEYSLSFYQPLPRYVRIMNVSTGTAAGGGSTLLIDEGFATGLAPPDGWVFNSISNYTSSGNFGRESPSLRFDATGDYVDTPSLSHPTNLKFWIKGQSISPASRFEVLGFITGNWVLVQAYTNISNTAVTNTLVLSTNITRLRFLYANKVAGNIAFDDVIIRGVLTGGQPPQDALIDDINIELPIEYRSQDFEAWPRKNFFNSGVHVFQNWRITNSIVNDENAFQGQSLRTSTDTGGFIQSPEFPDGIGLLSFDYARWPGTPAPTLAVQYTTNLGASWVTVTNLVITNNSPNFIRFERLLNVSTSASVRLIHTSGARQVLIDNIVVGFPQPPADVTLVGFHDPPTPFTNDAIRLNAVVSPVYGAQVTNLTAFYRFGTNGAFAALPMTQSNVVFYQTSTLLGPHPTGTVVQYYFRVQFTGPGAATTSPRFFPAGGSNAPAFYAIPRAVPGQVWINEVRYEGGVFYDNDFIELAGPALFDISGWVVELVAANATGGLDVVTDKYVMTNGSKLTTNAFPFGFWVLGTTEVPNRNMTIDGTVGDFMPFGIRLLNEGGGLEHAISFGGNMSGFERIYEQDNFFEEFASVGLAGTATNYAGFTWTNTTTGSSPGFANVGQTFGSLPPTNLPPPDAWIMTMSWGTNVTITAVGNTNAWYVAPFFTTALTNNATWLPITPFNVATSGFGTNTVWFDRPTNSIWFLRLRYTHP